jgi:thiosulfate dehydrogenase [quinone] large subunit
MNALKNPALTGLVWLMARLWLGYEWLHAGIEKVFGEGNVAWIGDKAGAGVAGFLKGAIAKSPLADGYDIAKTPHPAVSEWYATLARDVFIPNAQLMSYLVAYGELLVGIALIVGIFTRFSALMGGVMALAFLLAGTTSSGLPILLTVALAITLSGKTPGLFGLDYFARPIETSVLRRVFPQAAPATPQAG